MAQPTARETKIIQAIIAMLNNHPGIEAEFIAQNAPQPFCGYLRLLGSWGAVQRPVYTAWNITVQQAKLLTFQLQAISAQQPLLLADYVPESLAQQLHHHQLNYLDTIGNGYINAAPLFYEVSGRRKKSPKLLPNRSLQVAGTKIIYQLLKNDQLGNQPYRTIAQQAQVALGAVGPVIKELQAKQLLVDDIHGQRHIANKTALRQLWEGGYLSRLRPKLQIERCSLSLPWTIDNMVLLIKEQKLADQVLIGGELAAAFYCEHAQPQSATLHLQPQAALKQMLQLRLIPCVDGPISIIGQFATNDAFEQRSPEGLRLADPRLVRAELLYADESSPEQLAALAETIERDYLLVNEAEGDDNC